MAIFLVLNYNPSHNVTFVDVELRLNKLGEAEMVIKCLCFWKAVELTKKSLEESKMSRRRAKESRVGLSPQKYRL